MEEKIDAWLTDHESELCEIADFIFQHPETAYEEKQCSKCLADLLEEQGFAVTFGTAGIETAFTAQWESPAVRRDADTQPADEPQQVPVIGFLAEYDALPGLGHACGHNLLGTAVCGAACALKAALEDPVDGEPDLPVILRVYGCPAEETLSGKIVMNEAGVFDDLTVAVTWHPFDRNRVSNDIWQAQDIKIYTFHGLSAHASKAPEAGRSALDAAELMNVGVNYLREHVADEVRIHYAYLNSDIPANVVPDLAQTKYFIRSNHGDLTVDASRRVDLCAQGAATMTETTVEIEKVSGCREMKVNRVLTELYYEAMQEIPTPTYTDEELATAAEITEEYGFDNQGEYFTGLEPLEDTPVPIAIGTDAAEVSHTVPLILLSAATMCKGTPLHHEAAARQAGCSIGQKGMMYAAQCMAQGTWQLLHEPGKIEEAWAWHRTH